MVFGLLRLYVLKPGFISKTSLIREILLQESQAHFFFAANGDVGKPPMPLLLQKGTWYKYEN